MFVMKSDLVACVLWVELDWLWGSLSIIRASQTWAFDWAFDVGRNNDSSWPAQHFMRAGKMKSQCLSYCDHHTWQIRATLPTSLRLWSRTR